MAKTLAPSRLCNRTVCRQPNATWWNPSTRAWYCQKCALKINEANGELCMPTVGICESCYGPIIHFVDLCQLQDGNDIISLDQICWRRLGEPLTAAKYRAAVEAANSSTAQVPLPKAEPSVRVRVVDVVDHLTGDVRLRNAANDPPADGRMTTDHDCRIITAVSIALGGTVGLDNDVERLMQQIVRGHSNDKLETAVEIAVAFIRFSQDLKRKLPPKPSPVVDALQGKNAWEFACGWYQVAEIMRSIMKRSRDSADSTYVPPNIDSSEFAVWLTEQYRLAMRKGIELGLGSKSFKEEVLEQAAQSYASEVIRLQKVVCDQTEQMMKMEQELKFKPDSQKQGENDV